MRISQVGALGLLIVAGATGANAQSSASMPPRRFGITVGANSATLGGNDASGSSRHTGLYAGALAVFPFSSTLAFEPEIAYATKGATAHDNADPTSSGTLQMAYLQIPALIRFELAAATTGPKPFIYAGPSIAFKTSCNFELHGQGVTLNSDCDQLDGANFASTDLSLIGGAGMAFNMSGRTIGIAVRYDHSLSKIDDQVDLKHRVISILGTIEFPSGR
jgi:hypothetical protein